VITATASPYKFPVPVAAAIGLDAGADGEADTVEGQLALAEKIARASKTKVPRPIAALRGAREVHSSIVDPKRMEESLESLYRTKTK